MTRLLFTDMVAVVTGAGGGLGRIYSLELARRGALVVVNDLGSYRTGDGYDVSPANNVVKEIKEFGGRAIANYDSVENGDKVIESAIKTYGKIDILINNAGILRDKTFSRLEEEDWLKIINIHLHGAYKTTKAAWNYMKSQNFGRIIFTTSASGIYGNFGQTNYSSAKSGLIGMCRTLAIEGLKYNINCNAIAPIAGSRMTEDVFPPELFENLRPEYVAPLVTFLCHKDCVETGSIFEVGAGWIGKTRIEVSMGKSFPLLNNSFTAESVRDSWLEITDFSKSDHPTSIKESMENFMSVVAVNISNHSNLNDIRTLNDLIGKSFSSKIEPFVQKDCILYALSVGVNNLNSRDLKLLYENNNEFSILPTFPVIPVLNLVMHQLNTILKLTDLDINLFQILHGEQYLEVFQPFPLNEKLNGKLEIVDIVEKVRGSLVAFHVNLYRSDGTRLCFSEVIIYIKGFGNYGGARKSTKIIPIKSVPSRIPDLVIEQNLLEMQAALYRLNGDYNPLHIDPEIAFLAGFEKPILHGLCVLGAICYQSVKNLMDYDVSKFKSIKLRFSKPVKPGETLIIEFWKSNSLIQFQCKVKETNDICISGGFIAMESMEIKAKI